MDEGTEMNKVSCSTLLIEYIFEFTIPPLGFPFRSTRQRFPFVDLVSEPLPTEPIGSVASATYFLIVANFEVETPSLGR